MEPVFTVNVAIAELPATATEAGTVRTFAIPPERVTKAPSDLAVVANAMVQVALAFEPRLAGAHCRDEINTGPVAVVVAIVRVAEVKEPFSDAVTVALRLAVMEPVLAVNVAVVALPATATEAGTVRTLAMRSEER